MARLIEFFTRTGELVLDPFAGVGGTLLGAAIARGPRRAIGIELEPRWVEVYETVARELAGERDGAGPVIADLGRPIRAARAASTRPAASCGSATRWRSCRPSPDGSIDFVATDPPYNVQLPLTMAGGKLAEAHANRRTDYAMVTDSPADLANAPDYATFLDRMGDAFGEIERVLRPGRYAVFIVRDAYQDGRYLFTGADLAARAAATGLVPKGDLIWYQAGTRLRPYGYPRAFVPNIAHQHIIVLRKDPGGLRRRADARRDRRRGRRRRRRRRTRPSSSVSAETGRLAVGVSGTAAAGPTMSPRVILWIQPRPPLGRLDQAVDALALQDHDLVAGAEDADLVGRAARPGRPAGGPPCSGRTAAPGRRTRRTGPPRSAAAGRRRSAASDRPCGPASATAGASAASAIPARGSGRRRRGPDPRLSASAAAGRAAGADPDPLRRRGRPAPRRCRAARRRGACDRRSRAPWTRSRRRSS